MGKAVQFFLICVLSSVHFGESYECGVRKINSSQEISSENGATYPGQWPWHSAIYQSRAYSALVFVCGGTLVSAKFVLTAGLCILDGDGNLPESKSLFIRLGVFNLNAPSLNTGQNRWVSRIHQPYLKRPVHDRVMVTLLELSSRAVFTDYVQPACIYQLKGIDNRMIFTWPFGTTVGWGQTWDDHEAVLKSSTLSIPLLLDCYSHDRGYEDNSLFCAGSANGTDLCQKDSGNGLYVELRGVWHVAAVVSLTPQSTNNHCRTDSFVGLTNLYDSMMWISSVAKLPHLLEKIILKDGLEFDPTKSYRNLLPRHCGSFLQNRITKGKTAPLFAYPWMGFLANRLKDVDEVKFICAGSLISKRYVLTARFCTSFNNLPEFVRLGDHTIDQDVDCNVNDESDCAPPFRDYYIKFIVHNKDDSNICYRNNIALIRLKTDVIYEEHIQPICLPVTPDLRRQKLDQYTITGWGGHDKFFPHSRSRVLRVATIGAASVTECDRNYVNYRNDPDPATGRIWFPPLRSAVHTCVGDDGGPLGCPVALRGTVRFVQFGVIAYGLPGCSGGPSVYVNVSRQMDWIVANMEE